MVVRPSLKYLIQRMVHMVLTLYCNQYQLYFLEDQHDVQLIFVNHQIKLLHEPLLHFLQIAQLLQELILFITQFTKNRI